MDHFPYPLNKDGCRLLAIKVIGSAYDNDDTIFFESEWYKFWAALAYANKDTHIEGKEVNDKIVHKEKKTSKQGRKPRWK